MIVAIAFASGVCVTAASVFVPHARTAPSSIEEFKSLQKTLSSLSSTTTKKH